MREETRRRRRRRRWQRQRSRRGRSRRRRRRERSGSDIYRERLLVVWQNVGEEPRGASERGEKRRDGPFFLRAPWLSAAFAPCSRSKLEADSQKLPVPVESAWSWIILPKGIFIGRECMQKRGHRHKGAAPADLALTQLREWTHDFVPAASNPQSEQTPRNGLPNFPPCRFCCSFLPSFLSPFFPSFSPFLSSILPFSVLPSISSFLAFFFPSYPFLSVFSSFLSSFLSFFFFFSSFLFCFLYSSFFCVNENLPLGSLYA